MKRPGHFAVQSTVGLDASPFLVIKGAIQSVPTVGVLGRMPGQLDLTGRGFNVIKISNGRQSVEAVRERIDLWIVEWPPRHARAETLLEPIRTRRLWCPVIAVLESRAEARIIRALQAGADACVHASTSRLELEAHACALLSRHPSRRLSARPLRRYRNIEFDFDTRTVSIADQRVALSASEFRLAALLFEQLGHTVRNADLIDFVRGDGLPPASRTLSVLCSKVRRRLNLRHDAGWHLHAVHDVGYRLQDLWSVSREKRA